MALDRRTQDDWITVHADSRRWQCVEMRPDDIVISTPPKSGTTWMQGIVYSLLWPAGDAPVPLQGASPWIDMRLFPIDDVAADVAGQQHRRFLKTHTPADCLSIDDDIRYVVVYRDGRDAFVSWMNHRSKMRPEVVEALSAAAAADGLAPLPPTWSGDLDELWDEWFAECSSVRHLAPWWPLRHRRNVCFVHYADLLADLEGEMRRLADFLDVVVSAEHWPAAVDRCRIDEMRAAAAEGGLLEKAFDGGADAFFNQGTNGRWRDVLTDAQVDRYLRDVDDGLPPDAAAWLEHGSLALGFRPDGVAL